MCVRPVAVEGRRHSARQAAATIGYSNQYHNQELLRLASVAHTMTQPHQPPVHEPRAHDARARLNSSSEQRHAPHCSSPAVPTFTAAHFGDSDIASSIRPAAASSDRHSATHTRVPASQSDTHKHGHSHKLTRGKEKIAPLESLALPLRGLLALGCGTGTRSSCAFLSLPRS